MKLGFIGLGKMGAQMVERLIKDGHEVVVFDVNQAAIEASVRTGATGASDRANLISQLGDHPVIWMMIPSQFVDEEVKNLSQLLGEGAVLIDGGNSDFRLTQKRAELLRSNGIDLIDVGTSGGVLGREAGFSMMVGGAEAAFNRIEPIIKSLAQPNGYHYFGSAGSGHFVKMVHNGIEYGLMQAYAEGYQILKEGPYPDLDLAAAAEVWEHGSIISSKLNELTAKILKVNPELEGVEGVVAESGEARWTLEIAQEHNIPAPAIKSAFDTRIQSQQGKTSFATRLLALMRNAFGGHDINVVKKNYEEKL